MLAPVIAYLGMDMAEFKAGAVEAEATMDGLSETAGDSGKLSKAFKTLGAIGLAAAIGIGVASVDMAATFDSSMARLVTSAGETQSNLGLVSNGVLDLAVSTGTSTSQLASGLYMIESAGYHGAAGLLVLKAAAEGAKDEGADLGEVANAVTSGLNAYHLPASQAVAVTDELVATVGSGKTTMQALASAISSVLPVAAAAGISLAQVGGAVATMTMQGMSADQATQDLAFTIRSLQSPSTVAQQAMAAVGLSSQDLAEHLGQRGLTGTMALISQAILQRMGPSGLVLLNTFNQSQTATQSLTTMLDAMPPSLKKLVDGLQAGSMGAYAYQTAVKALPSKQAAMGAQFETLLKSSQGFTNSLKNGSSSSQTYTAELSKIMGGATGLNTALMISGKNAKDFSGNVNTVADAAKTAGANVDNWGLITQTFSFKMAQLREVVETTGIRIGNVLIPVLMVAITFFEKHQDAALALAGVIGGVLLAAMVNFSVATTVAAAKSAILLAQTVATTIADWAETAAIAGLYIAEGIASAATAVLDAVMDANPIVLIIIALVALGVAVYEAFEHVTVFRHAIEAAFHAIAAAATFMWRDNLKPQLDAIVDAFEWVGRTAANLYDGYIKPVFDGIGAGAMWLWHDVFEPTFDGIGRAVLYAWSNIIEPVGKFIVALIRLYIAVELWMLKETFEAVWWAISAVVDWAWSDVIEPAWAGLVIAAKAVGAAALWLWDEAFRPALNAIGDAAMWLWHDAVLPAFHGIGDVVSGTWTDVIRPTWHAIEDGIGGLETGALWLWHNAIEPAWKGIGAAISDVWHDVIEPVFNAIETAVDKVTGAVNKVVGLGKGALNAGSGALNSVSKMLGFADGGWVPGGAGAAQLAVVHGGEYVLSQAMISGSAPIDANAVASTAGSLAGGSGGGGYSGGGAGGGSGSQPVVIINVNGSLLSTARDIVEGVTEAFAQAGHRNGDTWPAFST
jgi:hypothetical protein